MVDLRAKTGGLNRSDFLLREPGELSGEREGNDTRDLAESGIEVTRDCFREVDRRGPGRCEEFETSEFFRSRLPFGLLCMVDTVKASVSTFGRIFVSPLRRGVEKGNCH